MAPGIFGGESSVAEKPDLFDTSKFRGMVGWFDPIILAKTARKALDSALFGQYADRRLIHASLDPVDPDSAAKRYDLRKQLKPKDGAVWVDYVADLGDGFDSTYAIAYLLGQKEIEIESHGRLPRGQCLIMGGDQVYPDATSDDYRCRMRIPYTFAFPNSDAGDADHPPVFLIPGNHDWYDGLTLFLAIFCRGRPTKLGSWRATQHRSYFALQLPHNWWIWGYDSQLGEDIDGPQADYFVTVARSMKGNPKVILCAPTPTWLKAELTARDSSQRAQYYRALHYMAFDILNKECPKARVCAVLSGDLHHYSRYSAELAGAQFITAGGGGAFLHPTHQLKDTIDAAWVRQRQTLSLKTEPGPDHKPCDEDACYPKREESRKMALGNLKFAVTNPKFCLALGLVYWVVAQLLMFSQDDVFDRRDLDGFEWASEIAAYLLSAPMYWVLSLTLVAILYVSYTDAKGWKSKLSISAVHGLFHAGLILALLSALPPINNAISQTSGLDDIIRWALRPGTIGHAVLFFFEVVVIGGFIGGVIWGLYLLLVSYFGAIHSNDAFSAMRLDSHKHFLRMRIKDNELAIYPIALDQVPSRSGWRVDWPNNMKDQNRPMVVPKTPLVPYLIEGPVVIRVPEVQSIEEVAKAK